MDDSLSNRGGFSYHVRDEQIDEYQKIPIAERLEWLEELQEFIHNTLSEEKKKILHRFRHGEI